MLDGGMEREKQTIPCISKGLRERERERETEREREGEGDREREIGTRIPLPY